MPGYGDNFIVVIPVEEGDLIHTAKHPFCDNPTCLCHEDQELIAGVTKDYQCGLLTPQEASRIVEGRQL